VPPHQLHSSAEHEDDFSVNLTKEQIKAFPQYNEPDIESDEKRRQCDAAWQSGPVHREGSDRNLNPTPNEMPPEPGNRQSAHSQRKGGAEFTNHSRNANEVTMDVGATGIG
jgi:hypothetical protein